MNLIVKCYRINKQMCNNEFNTLMYVNMMNIEGTILKTPWKYKNAFYFISTTSEASIW